MNKNITTYIPSGLKTPILPVESQENVFLSVSENSIQKGSFVNSVYQRITNSKGFSSRQNRKKQ